MEGYIFLVILIVTIISTTIIANYTFILTKRQVYEMWFSSIYFVIFLGYARVKLLKMDNANFYTFVPATFYLFWYILVKVFANFVNKDGKIIRDSDY